MRKLGIFTAIAVSASLAGFAGAQDIKQYTVNWTASPPAIDGSGQLSTGAWAAAEAPAGDFRLLRTAGPNGDPSPENIQWQALWDDDALYVLIVSNFTTWGGVTTGPDDSVPLTETLEIFLDPNREDEPNVTDADPNARDSDSYQLMISMPADSSEVRAAGAAGPPYFNSLARYNALFGDNVTSDATPGTGWNPDQIAFSRTTSVTGGKAEFRIPFAQLDAVSGTNIGLDASDGPSNGEVWLFNVARISTAAAPNNLPMWSFHEGAASPSFFAERPHGEITFAGQPGETAVEAFELYF